MFYDFFSFQETLEHLNFVSNPDRHEFYYVQVKSFKVFPAVMTMIVWNRLNCREFVISLVQSSDDSLNKLITLIII